MSPEPGVPKLFSTLLQLPRRNDFSGVPRNEDPSFSPYCMDAYCPLMFLGLLSVNYRLYQA